MLPAETQLPDLVLELNPEAPSELQEIATNYWQNAGVDDGNGLRLWAHKPNEIDFQSWTSSAHYAAAAGGVATAVGYECATCGGPLTLSSRKTFQDRGLAPQCRTCSGTVDAHSAKLSAPEAVKKRAHYRERQQAAAAAAERAQELARARREHVATNYAIESVSSTDILEESTLLARIGTLAVVQGAGDQEGLVPGIALDDALVAPSPEFTRDVIRTVLDAGLLCIHPSSPNTAFAWEEDTATPAGSIYSHLTRFYAAGEGALYERLNRMVAKVREHLKIENLWSTHRDELVKLSQRIVAEEAARYFVFQLVDLRLPDLTDTHSEALRTTTSRAAQHFELGRLYAMAWSAAQAASSAKQRNRGMSGENAVTFGLRQFEKHLQSAIDDPTRFPKPFNEHKTRLPLAAITDVVFHEIFSLDPMLATPQEVVARFGDPPDEELRARCNAGIPDHQDLIEWLRTASDKWTPTDLRMVLARLEDWEPPLCAPHCAHERVGAVAVEVGHVFDKSVSRIGDSNAALIAAESSSVANSLREGVRTGDAVLSELVRVLRDDMMADTSY